MPDKDLPQTVAGLLQYAVQRFGDSPAVATNAGELSYSTIAASSQRLAKGLLAIGAGKGARVGVLAGNIPFWIEALFACAQIGAVMIPISTLAAPPELAQILRHSDTQFLLASRRYSNRDFGEIIARALPSLASASDRASLRVPEAPFLRAIWLDDTNDVAWASSLSELIDRGATDKKLDDVFLDHIRSEVTSSDDGVVIYTSGSTAAPKAVIHAQGPMVRQAWALTVAQIAKPGERILCLMPLFWVGGLNLLLELFVTGGCLVLPVDASTRAAVDALRDVGADALHAWPPQRSAVRALMQADGLDISGIRNLREERTTDGAVRSPDSAPNSLGMTESFGPHGIMKMGALLPPHRRGAFAPASGGFERRVVDVETGAILGPGERGELQIRGGSLMRGYHKRTYGETFAADGFFSTNDLVRIEADGYMYFEGRSGDTIKSKGANVSRLEVEAALRKIPGIAEAIVCGLSDPEYGEIVAAAVTAAESTPPAPASIKSALRELIAPYKIPTYIIIVDDADVAWTASGKIRRAEMRQLIAQRLGRSA